MVTGRDDVVGLDSSVILPRRVWEASGHVEVSATPRRVHQLPQAPSPGSPAGGVRGEEGDRRPRRRAHVRSRLPRLRYQGQWTEPREFSGLLKTFLGPVADEEGLHYLRPETAQGIFVNFKNVMTTARKKPPFGIAQIGKASATRSRRATSSSGPASSSRWRWSSSSSPAGRAVARVLDQGAARLVCRPGYRSGEPAAVRAPLEKLSHYSKGTTDVEYRFGFGGNPWGELEGIANRTDYDLSTHSSTPVRT